MWLGRDPKFDTGWRNPYGYLNGSVLIAFDPDGKDKVYMIYVNLPAMTQVVEPSYWSHSYIAVATDDNRVISTYSFGANVPLSHIFSDWLLPQKNYGREPLLAQEAISGGDARLLLHGDGLRNDADAIFSVEGSELHWYDVGISNCKQWGYGFAEKVEMRSEFRGGNVEKDY